MILSWSRACHVTVFATLMPQIGGVDDSLVIMPSPEGDPDAEEPRRIRPFACAVVRVPNLLASVGHWIVYDC